MNQTNNPEGVNIYGSGLVGKIEIDTTETRSYYLKDHLGNIRCAVNNDGTLLNAQDYYPYGELLRSYNNNRYLLTEKERDAESSNDYFGARYYNNKLGVWLQVDPLSEKYPGWSPYNYTLCNPMRFVDPKGMEAEETEEEKEQKQRVSKSQSQSQSNTGVLGLSAAVAEAIQIFGLSAIKATTGVLSLLTLSGDTEIDKPKIITNVGAEGDSKNDDFRVRIQVQGGNVEMSYPYVGNKPMSVAEGISALNTLKSGLSARELKVRTQAFEKAEKWLMDISKAGGLGPYYRSFTNKGVNGSNARVDIEILKGINFSK